MEEDIDYLKRHIKAIGKTRSTEAIENLINKYKEQEKMIELALDCLSVWAMCADDEGCFCTVKGKECNVVANEIEGQEHTTCKECLIDYFRKKVKGE